MVDKELVIESARLLSTICIRSRDKPDSYFNYVSHHTHFYHKYEEEKKQKQKHIGNKYSECFPVSQKNSLAQIGSSGEETPLINQNSATPLTYITHVLTGKKLSGFNPLSVQPARIFGEFAESLASLQSPWPVH